MSRRRPSPFWVIDSETDPFKADRIPRPFVWGAYGGDDHEYHVFDTAADVANFFCRQKTVVYAHNGGKFDYHFMREYINSDEQLSLIAGRLARFKIGVCEFRDSMNILPVPLAAFKKDKIDYSIFEEGVRDDPNNRAEILRYLHSDCQYLHELISAHRKENGIVLTQASASMKKWLKESKTPRPKQSGVDFERYKPFYYGGRVQCFKQGAAYENFNVIDINSAYPFAMLSRHPLDTQAIWMDKLPPEGEIDKCMVRLRGIAKGCFPWRDPKDNSLYFPEDERTIREYNITGYELIAALKHDAIKIFDILDVHYFALSTNFKDFILSNWERRAEAKRNKDDALSLIVKLLMNSLYGKFASDYEKYHDYVIATTDSFANWIEAGFEKDCDFDAERFLMARPLSEDKHKYYNIATAASITGYVRAMIFEALQQCSNPIYCDTDSIAAGDVSRCNMGDDLGQWKIEGEFDHYAVAGKKTYAFHKKGTEFADTLDDENNYLFYKLASKGVDLSPSEILRVASGETVTFKPQVPTYSVKRKEPIFIDRSVKRTAKNIGVIV